MIKIIDVLSLAQFNDHSIVHFINYSGCTHKLGELLDQVLSALPWADSSDEYHYNMTKYTFLIAATQSLLFCREGG